MIHVPVAAAKNTSIAAEGKVMMTNEELNQSILEVNEKISKFGPDNQIANKEYRQKRSLLREKSLLEDIQKSKENGSSLQEAKSLMQYMFLKEEKKMNPFFRYIMQMKFRSHIWY